MVAGGTILARAQPWLQHNARYGLRVLLPLPILAIVWWLASMQLTQLAVTELVAYAAVNLALLGLLRFAQQRLAQVWVQVLLVCVALTDVLLAFGLLAALGPLTPAVFPLYAILLLKTARFRGQSAWMGLAPALLGPVYLAALAFYAADLAALSTGKLAAFWGLIGASCLSQMALLAMGNYRLRQSQHLNFQFETARCDYESRVAELESINNDLRVRIRSQQALEESLRAITGSLSLDDVLQQILDSMTLMIGRGRILDAGLTLLHKHGFTHHTLGIDPESATRWAEPLTRRVVQERRALIVDDAMNEREWRELYRSGVLSALSVPLIDSDDVVRGALTVVSSQRHAFTNTEARHLNSFSIQAAVAIHNAELHAQLTRQRLILESVVRDIGDGLLVLDEQGDIVLSNPLGNEALAFGEALGAGLREQLVQLAVAVRTEQSGVLTRDLRAGEPGDAHERMFQAFASLVRISEREPSHVAIVLHDVTENKMEERLRSEFISMVSHELRNPLNTLNGFLKIVLQGRTGELSELQREFLEMADNQANLLKGRVVELLEFNRLEAGRLKLQPTWGDLAALIEATGARLQLQTEQAGLKLVYGVTAELSEFYMDGERINQVLTNLVENAIKATPAGGTIEIGADMCDTEVQIYVSDTGVGIPREEQSKIFGRFYRLHHKASHHGAHLGLGLSICQQIVEGHHGRIWVESEEGKGSRFIFTLPTVAREQMLGKAAA